MSLLLTILFVPLFLSPTIFAHPTEDVKIWCSQTPHPQPCEYFLSDNPSKTPIKQKSDFLKVSKQLALERGSKALGNVLSLGLKCRNAREKAAWADCLELYQETISRINKTVNPSSKCTQTDAQTWLSTALTNLETCREGFIELGVSDYVLPLMTNNVSKLISNTLAINHVPHTDYQPSYRGGFPTWVKGGDRKLLQSSSPASQANIVVAQDGSGKYKTIQEAITAASERSGSGSVGGGSTTFNSATLAVVGDNFIARDITIQNTAGASNHQAVALRSGSDLSVFYRCSLEGYQDTVYVHSQRQFYRECNIYGTVDFIFGNAAVVFQNCNIYARYPPNKTNTITAQGRTDPNQNTGISIHNCKVTAASDLKSSQSSVKTFLGRPWKEYSRTVFMKTYLDSLIVPAGWMEWSGNFALKTLYYGEYANTGPGSSTTNRVKWPGYHVITSSSVASQYTVANFIAGNSWLLGTNVPYTASL
ncbi:hypothetical protein SLA2020_337790 [Shorea laevis]